MPKNEVQILQDKLAQCEAECREYQKQGDELAEAVALLKSGRSLGYAPAMFLLILIVVVLGRLTLWVFVEQMGSAALQEADIANKAFGAIAAFLILNWLYMETKAAGLMVIPKAITVAVAILVSASIFDPAIWDWKMALGQPFEAVGLLVGTLVIVASPFWQSLLEGMQNFIISPMRRLRIVFRFRKTHG